MVGLKSVKLKKKFKNLKLRTEIFSVRLSKINLDGIDYVHKVKLEVVVNNDMVDNVVNTIQLNAHTGLKGDGNIFNTSV